VSAGPFTSSAFSPSGSLLGASFLAVPFHVCAFENHLAIFSLVALFKIEIYFPIIVNIYTISLTQCSFDINLMSGKDVSD
jgi:hypothetical protein